MSSKIDHFPTGSFVEHRTEMDLTGTIPVKSAPVGQIRDLENKIRDFINHYRNSHALIQNADTWNILTSSLDVVGDTELAIAAYKNLENEQDDGFNYLAVYGIFQVLYVQQDAVRHIFETLDISLKLVDPAKFADVRTVRDVRNKATGHPTKHGMRKEPVTSHYISRNTLSLSGFTLLSAEGRKTEFSNINIPELLQKQEAGVVQALEAIVAELSRREKEHKLKFQNQTVSSLFPNTLGYFFQKVNEGIGNDNQGRREYGKMHVEVLIELLGKLRQAFIDRAVLPASDVTERALNDAEYALQKLKAYYASDESNTLNDKDAEIFASFLEAQFDELKTLARETDEELAIP